MTQQPMYLTQEGEKKLRAELAELTGPPREELSKRLRSAIQMGDLSENADISQSQRQGKSVADAAKAAGVQHLVYSSVGGADRAPGVMHFESKWEIEQYIHSLGIPCTILRPVAFMDNYNWSRPS